MPVLKRLAAVLRRRGRRRRYAVIARHFNLDEVAGPILDLGGGLAGFFAGVHARPDQVVLVDVDPAVVRQAAGLVPGLRAVVADGHRLPFADGSIGLTICNSVIEHVRDPEGLAREIERVSRAYFVQTPDGRFVLETHSFVPIPFYRSVGSPRLRAHLCRIFGADVDYVESVRYLDADRLQRIFPRARLIRERVAGVTKSFYLIAGARRG